MQQEKRWRVFRPGLSVKDGESIYLYRAIKSRVFHGTFLSLGVGRQVKYCEHHRNQQEHSNLQESVPTGRVERVHSLPPRLEILYRWADNHLIDFHLDRLLDCVSDRSRDRAGRDGHF